MEYTEKELRAHLRKAGVRAGVTVYTVLEHVSSSGMARRIKVFCIGKDYDGKAQIKDITFYTAKLCGYKTHKGTGALVVYGCGMDMGFDTVYTLGEVMWPKGTRSPHGTRNGQPDRSGGYALKHRWL